MKVVIAIDESRWSRAAVEWVRDMTWPLGTRIVVLSVVEAAVYAIIEYGGTLVDDPLQERVREREEQVARAERELKKAGLVVSGRVTHGVPSDTIVDAAATEKADLVVVGSHGRTGLTRLLMGSVASHVLTHAPCSVLVVREPRAAERRQST
jgi:universal stress protein A